MQNELHWMTIVELSALLRSRQVSPVELANAFLDRIAGQERAGAYITVTADRALDQARVAEREILAGRWTGPLHGIPLGMKDMFHTDFAPTTNGMGIWRDFIAPESATVVKRLEAAGAITLGKLALTEGCVSTHHPELPTPLNPWNEDYWCGFSSSGSGVAVASGLCAAAMGSDTGGSIRFPAAANGLTGLKPGIGRVSQRGTTPFAESFDTFGPMTRTAEDAAIVLGAIAGWDPACPTSSSTPVPDYVAALGEGIQGVAIGLDEQFAFEGVDRSVEDGLRDTIAIWRSCGADVKAVTLPRFEELMATYIAVAGIELAASHRETYPARAAEYGQALSGLIDVARQVTTCMTVDARRRQRAFAGSLDALLRDVDLIVLPVIPRATPSRAAMEEMTISERQDLIRLAMPFNLSGHPAIALPAGFDANAMPRSVQLIAAEGREDLLLRAGHALQQCSDWHRRRPPMKG